MIWSSPIRFPATLFASVAQQRKVFLHADPPEMPAIELDQQADMEVWGVVTYCVHRVR